LGCLGFRPARRPFQQWCTSWFGGKGIFDLVFLKAYLNVSNRQLLERYNNDWTLQYFCGRVQPENRQIKDITIMTRIREDLEKTSEWEKL
jgi:transposase, IS5 family